MKKYQLGALTVSDKGLQDTKEEVVIELIDRMQKYVAEGKAAYENGDYTTEQKLNAKVTMISKGAKHPYHLVKESGGGSTVYGWVNAADVQSEADAAIDKLAGLGVINSPDYWKSAVAAGTVQYLDLLFISAAEHITKAGPRCATVQAGVDALVKAGAINSPDYWLQNYGKLQSLDLLLCALGGAV